MSYKENVAQTEAKYVTKRYKVTKCHNEQLTGIEERIGVSPSMVVRLALDILLPRLQNENITDIDAALDRIFNK